MNITKQQLVNLIDQLAESQEGWNDCVEEPGERGRDNKALVIILTEDSSGFLCDIEGFRKRSGINILDMPMVIVQAEFNNAEECADALIKYHDALEEPGK